MFTRSRYLVASPKDHEWGMVVTSTGRQDIAPGSDYPPEDHPIRYLFTRQSGRVLNEFQLVYIVRGGGFFKNSRLGRQVSVSAGDMFVLIPGEWHSYWPSPESGWEEYWIGFSGVHADGWLSAGYMDANSQVIHPGLNNHLISLYEQALEMAVDQKSTFQQVLCSIASNILFSALFLDRNRGYEEDSSSIFVRKAKELIVADIAKVSPESLASSLGLGYSKFRKLFKAYTGLAPGQYIMEIRVMMAREKLTNTDLQIQEIAWDLGFDNPDYFNTAFKRSVGLSPGAFRTASKCLRVRSGEIV